MRSYFCKDLDTEVSFVCKQRPDYLEVLMYDSEVGVFSTISIPFSTGRKFTAYIDAHEYPWLEKFLVDNKVATMTHRSFIYNGHLCQEFNFMEEILYERKNH